MAVAATVPLVRELLPDVALIWHDADGLQQLDDS